ncbi:MAG: hypothetical protein ACRDVE_02465, partial [Actinocrinis sp.]
HAREVRRLHEKLFYRPLLAAVARLDEGSAAGAVPVPVGSGASGAPPRLSAQAARARLEALGYADPAGALANIEALATGVSRRAAIQRTLLPVMLGWFADAPDPDAGLLAFRRVSDALGDTPWYLRSLRDEGEAAWRLARVLTCGGYVPDLLLRDPGAVALLGDDRALAPRPRAAVEAEMAAVVDRATSAEQAVTAVRAVRRRELFRIVAADLLGLLGTADSVDSGAASMAPAGSAGGPPAVSGAPVPVRPAATDRTATDRAGTPELADPLDVLGRALTDVTEATIDAALAAVIAFRGRAGASAGKSARAPSDATGGASGNAPDKAPDKAPVGPSASETRPAEPGHAEPSHAEATFATAGDVTAGGVTADTATGPPPPDGETGGGQPGAASADDAPPDDGPCGDLAAALPTRLAVIAMGRFGGAELGYGSDADVMFVHEPCPGADEHEATTLAFELANELRRLLQTPSPDPPLVIDADLRPEGRQGPLVRSLASYAEYYKRWSRVWESQALLRARPIAGAREVGERFVALVDPIRYPASGLTEPDLVEIRRLKARMEAERLPRGADRALHTKLGPGGLSDVEWVAQLLQLRYGADRPSLRVTSTRAVLAAANEAGLIAEADRALLDDAWYQTSRTRNGITLARGRPADQLPTGARDLAVIARYLDSWHRADDSAAADGSAPGSTGTGGAGSADGPATAAPNVGGLLLDRQRLNHEALVDAHRRRARRARAAFERLFYGRQIGDR